MEPLATVGKEAKAGVQPLELATAKNFAHRIPLRNGIYAHLEYTFTRSGPKELEWTYPDFRQEEYKSFFFQARRLLLVS